MLNLLNTSYCLKDFEDHEQQLIIIYPYSNLIPLIKQFILLNFIFLFKLLRRVHLTMLKKKFLFLIIHFNSFKIINLIK